MVVMTPALSLQAIVSAIACLCSNSTDGNIMKIDGLDYHIGASTLNVADHRADRNTNQIPEISSIEEIERRLNNIEQQQEAILKLLRENM